MEGKGKGKCWYGHGIQPWLRRLNMEGQEADIMKTKKSEWKKKLKDELSKELAKEMNEHRARMTKLRFTKGLEQQNYITKCRMEKVRKIMQMKLNMTELKANFKGKYNNTLSPACKKETETTEHVIDCDEYRQLTGHSLQVPDDWKEKMSDLEWLEEACEVREQEI